MTVAAFNTQFSLVGVVWCVSAYGCSQHPVFVFNSPDPPQPQTPVQSFSFENDWQRWEIKLTTRREKYVSVFVLNSLDPPQPPFSSPTLIPEPLQEPLLPDLVICRVCLFLSTHVHQLPFLLHNSYSEQLRVIIQSNLEK